MGNTEASGHAPQSRWAEHMTSDSKVHGILLESSVEVQLKSNFFCEQPRSESPLQVRRITAFRLMYDYILQTSCKSGKRSLAVKSNYGIDLPPMIARLIYFGLHCKGPRFYFSADESYCVRRNPDTR